MVSKGRDFIMPIVKRFSRPCIRCGKNFYHSSQSNKICLNCNKNNSYWLDKLIKKSKYKATN